MSAAYQTVLKSFAYLYLQFSGELPQTNDHALFLNVMYIFITSCHALYIYIYIYIRNKKYCTSGRRNVNKIMLA